MAYFQFVEEQKSKFQLEIDELQDKIRNLDNFNSAYDDLINEVHQELRDALQEIATGKVEELFEEFEIEDDYWHEKQADVLENLTMEFNL